MNHYILIFAIVKVPEKRLREMTNGTQTTFTEYCRSTASLIKVGYFTSTLLLETCLHDFIGDLHYRF